MGWTPPRRIVSSSTSVTISSGALPSWVPPPGLPRFGNILQSNGQPHDAMLINPDVIDANGNPTPYPNFFRGSAGGFEAVWNSQCGGAYAPLLGAYGSFLMFGGGHFTYSGPVVVRFDIESGTFSNLYYPPYCSTDKSIINGTVATLTGQVVNVPSGDTDVVFDRVGRYGHYIKTGDGVAIPNTDLDGVTTTNWIPAPFHTNIGTCVIPPEAGGGPLGTLVMAGHDQTGINVDSAHHALWMLDLATVTWSVWKHPFGAPHSFPGLEYDSGRKLLWYWYPSGGSGGTAIAFNFLTGTYHRTSGPSINFTANYGAAGACYVPTRQLMVYMLTDGPIGVAGFGGPSAPNDLNAEDEWSNVISVTAGDKFRVLRCNARFVSGVVTTVTLQRSHVSSTGPWTDLQQWSPSTTGPNGTPTDLYYDTTSDRLLATTIYYRIGIKTGDFISGGLGTQAYAYSRVPKLGVINMAGYTFGSNTALPTYFAINNQDLWTEWPKDDYVLMAGTGWPSNGHGVCEQLEYCEYEDCLYIFERPDSGPGDSPPTPRSANQTTKLWKLKLPAVGREQLDPWVWESETISELPGTGGIGFYQHNEYPHSGGKSAYVPALKSICFTDRPEVPAQIIRSADWV